jgi:hypothetical protein
MKPLAIELFAGLHGWGEGLVSEGFRVVGFDIVDMCRELGQSRPAGCDLVLQDVLTLHGSQFRDAAVIVASPPCQAYSYRAMPWKRAKALPPPSNELFDACFRIQREANQAANPATGKCIAFPSCRREAVTMGHFRLPACLECSTYGWLNYGPPNKESNYRYIPMVVENVKGAQPWVGRAAWHYGSFYLWGDVPALMPVTRRLAKGIVSANDDLTKIGGSRGDDWFVHHNTQEFFDRAGLKNARNWWSDGAGSLSSTTSSHSAARKAASAQIAKIPFALSSHIARVYHPGVYGHTVGLGPTVPIGQ